MSGVWGHMAHPYEDFNLSFADLKEIFKLATDGNLQNTTEKTDGQNIFFTFDVNNNELKFARNKTDIKNNGFIYKDILNKWQTLPNLQEGFYKGYFILSKALKSLNKKTLNKIFYHNNNNVWFSVEIIYSSWPNVIHYDRNILAIHKGSFIFSDDNNKSNLYKDTCNNFFILSKALEDLNKAIKNYEWTIMGPVKIKLHKSNKTDLYNHTISNLIQEIEKYNLNENNTIGEYVSKKFSYYVKTAEPNILQTDANKLGSLFIDDSILNLQKRKLASNVYNTKNINNLFLSKNRDKIIKKILNPIEIIVHDFSVELLDGVYSTIAKEPKKEVGRLRKRVEKEISKIRKLGDEKDIFFIKNQFEKLKNLEKITSSIEGIVFTYNNKIYKLTGNFAVINQILGLYRYR